MLTAFADGANDVAQRREALVDLLRLFELLALGARHENALRAGQVDEIQTKAIAQV